MVRELWLLRCALGEVGRTPEKTRAICQKTRQVLAKIDAALEANGTDKTRLLNAQIWLKDIRDRDAMNKLWVEWLGEEGRPARACVEANMADPRHLVEIMVNACK